MFHQSTNSRPRSPKRAVKLWGLRCPSPVLVIWLIASTQKGIFSAFFSQTHQREPLLPSMSQHRLDDEDGLLLNSFPLDSSWMSRLLKRTRHPRVSSPCHFPISANIVGLHHYV